MAHQIEKMFSVREKPWHYSETKELTKLIQEAPTSKEALRLAGLDWTVDEQPIFTEQGIMIPGYSANTRSSDGKVLGIVSGRYSTVQNAEAFAFTDALVGEGVTYETAGSSGAASRYGFLPGCRRT